MSSRKPKPGAVPGLCENQARSKVSKGQRKRPQDWQEGHPSSQAVITITTNSSSVCSEHTRSDNHSSISKGQGEKLIDLGAATKRSPVTPRAPAQSRGLPVGGQA